MFKRYGMNVHEIKKVKSLVMSGSTDIEIVAKLGYSSGQVDFVRNILCKGFNRVQDRRIGNLEKDVALLKDDSLKVGSQIYCKDDAFAVGTVIEMYPMEFNTLSGLVKFHNREYPTLCNLTKMTTSPDGKVRKLKRLS